MYSVELHISFDENEETKTQIEKSLNEIIAKLNLRHNEEHKLDRKEKKELIIFSKNSLWITEYLIEVRNLIAAYEIEDGYSVSVAHIVDFIAENKDEDIEDAVDYISSMVHVPRGLAEEGYIATDFSYAYGEDDVFYRITIKASELQKLAIIITTTLHEEYEKEKLADIVGLLDSKLESIVEEINGR